jgi:BASS family bile acid:Na+ symporter
MPDQTMTTIMLPIALFVIIFGMGLTLTPEDFLRVVRSPKAKLIGLSCQLVLLPLVAVALALAFRLPGELAVGLIIVASCPAGAVSNVLTHLAKGDTALSVTLTSISSIVSVFTLPWIIGWAMDYFLGEGAAVVLPFWKTLGQLALVTILPLLLGMLAKHARPALAARLARPANVFSMIFLAVIIAAAVGGTENLAEQFRRAGPAAITLNIVAMALAFFVARLAGLARPQRTAISLEVGIQNGTLALGICLGLLHSPTIAMPAVVYCLFMFFSGGLVVAWSNRRAGRP